VHWFEPATNVQASTWHKSGECIGIANRGFTNEDRVVVAADRSPPLE